MFAGGRRRSSNNVRAMQLFHELKQQFPTIPDHVVSACIANSDQRPADHVLREVLEAASTLQQELMGRNPTDHPLSPTPDVPDRQQSEPNNRTSKPNISKNINHALNNLGIEQKLNKRKTLEHTTKENLSNQIDSSLGIQKNTFKEKESGNLNFIKENLAYSKDSKETTNRNLKTSIKNQNPHKKIEHTSKDHHKKETVLKTEEKREIHKLVNPNKDNTNLNRRDKLENNKDTIEEFLPFHKVTVNDNLNDSETLNSETNTPSPQNSLLIGKGFSTFDKRLLLDKRVIREKDTTAEKPRNNNNLENHKVAKNIELKKENNALVKGFSVQKEGKDYKRKESSKGLNKETKVNIKDSHRRGNKSVVFKDLADGEEKLSGKNISKYLNCEQKSNNNKTSESQEGNSDTLCGNSKSSWGASASQSSHHQRLRTDMNQSESDLNRNIIPKSEPANPNKLPPPKRPDTLNLRSDNDPADSSCRIRQSEKCNNVFKLLNSNKPPKSPGTPKRQLNKPPTPQRPNLVKPSDSSDKKTETVETPTQTTNTLTEPTPPNLNLSLNVNYSVGVTSPKHTTALHVVPQQPWIPDLSSPRSFTSVNLTLRPPSSEPQPPIDITSQNSSLTYSTSTFDSQKGLQSKLQITVSPTGGCVSSIRTRPRSYHSGDSAAMEPMQQQRTSSCQDLSISPTIQKQQAKIDKLRIELRLENMRLIALQGEVQKLEAARSDTAIERTDAELEKQLLREIRHLRGQCERLTVEVDRQTENRVPLGETSEEFYRNIYTGQRGPFNFGLFDQRMTTSTSTTTNSSSSNNSRNRLQRQPTLPQSENFGPKWSCSVCTFQNHPLLDNCEQCDMARIVQGTPKPPDLSYLLNLQASLKPKQIVTAANNLLQHVTNNVNPEYLRRHSEGLQENGSVEGVVDTLASTLNNTH